MLSRGWFVSRRYFGGSEFRKVVINANILPVKFCVHDTAGRPKVNWVVKMARKVWALAASQGSSTSDLPLLP
jgi:hypothetical protein